MTQGTEHHPPPTAPMQPQMQSPMQYGQQPGQQPQAGYPQAYPPGVPVNVQAMPQQQVMGGTGAALLDGPPMLYARQNLDILEVACPACEKRNKYGIYHSPDQRDNLQGWTNVKEESECLARYCCNPHHPLKLTLFTPAGAPALVADRPCICCLQNMTLREAPEVGGRQIGSYQQECSDLWGCCQATTKVNNGNGDHIFTMKGPSPCYISCCMACPCRDPMDFEMFPPGSDQPIAKVQNVPTGCCKMCFTNADSYDITFPAQADRDTRALLFFYTFLLDYMFFQAKNQK